MATKAIEKAGEKNLVNNTDFENLAMRIRREKEEYEQSELKKQERISTSQLRRKNLRIAVASVYFYLRREIGKPPLAMTIEEFEITEKHLLEKAAEECKKNRHKILLFFGHLTPWNYYLKYGRFKLVKTPFGNWSNFHPWLDINFGENIGRSGIDTALSIPPNMENLVEKLFEKRFGVKNAD